MELLKSKKKAEESDRLKSVFLANISHEIRSPMNAIMGFSEILKKQNLPSDKQNRYVDIIQDKGKQLLNLITDIIDLSRIESNYLSVTPTSTNLNKILDDLNVLYQRKLATSGKGNVVKLGLKKYLNKNSCSMLLDENRLKQVLSNLLENAIKFTERGEINFGYTLRDDNMLQFYVRDTGIGIESEQQEIIFENFRQANHMISQKYGGTGLGLSIVKNLVELSGGKVWVNSIPGEGSEFNFTIPHMLPKSNESNSNILNHNIL
ncbi:MAG: HAMP domain-containing histidine kinase [Bacteroidales bacterium]|nr:HAMP domain-containing histidine kinase [Bacteroidales bacterium]